MNEGMNAFDWQYRRADAALEPATAKSLMHMAGEGGVVSETKLCPNSPNFFKLSGGFADAYDIA